MTRGGICCFRVLAMSHDKHRQTLEVVCAQKEFQGFSLGPPLLKQETGISFVGNSSYQALCSQLIKGVCLRVLGVRSYVVACVHVHTCVCMFSCTYMHEEAGGWTVGVFPNHFSTSVFEKRPLA